MAAPQTSSRLQLLQARFQQKQLQEKEQKLLQLYDQQQQRAHQVAQRGSAGSNSSSNGSSHSVVIAATRVQRQSFERLQSNAKGIDKSYPLEPLRKPAAAPGCPLGRSVSKAGQMSSSHRSVVAAKQQQQQQQQQRTSRADVSRSQSQRDPSYGPSRGGLYNGHSSLGVSRESCSSNREDYTQPPESIRKVNGHASNGRHYEINIDEVIDDAAMERNRMLAKYEARRFSGPDLVGFPGDELAADGAARKSPPQTEQPERSGGAGSRKPTVPSRKTVPTGGNAIRQARYMKTTKSASLKVRPLSRNRRAKEDRKKKSKLYKGKPKEQDINRSSNEGEVVRNFPGDSTLKSTSLICEVIRNHSKVDNSVAKTRIGKVKAILTRLESIAADAKALMSKSGTSKKKEVVVQDGESILKNEETTVENDKTTVTREEIISSEDKTTVKIEEKVKEEVKRKSPPRSVSKKRPSVLDSVLCKKDEGPGEKVTRGENKSESLEIEEAKETGGLVVRETRQESIERVTESQEITVADQTLNRGKGERRSMGESGRRASGESETPVRRASFELKRLMFEQILTREFSRRDSVESALQRFDSIEAHATPPPGSIASAKGNKKSRAADNSMSKRTRRAKQHKRTARGPAPAAADGSDHSVVRLCTEDSIRRDAESSARQQRKGFERHTNSWSIRTRRDKVSHSKSGLKPKELKAAAASAGSARGRRLLSRRKTAPGARSESYPKLLEARDSIELARVPVNARLPACKRKIILNSSGASQAARKPGRDPGATSAGADEAEPVKIQSYPREKRASLTDCKFSPGKTCKNKLFPSISSTIRDYDARDAKQQLPESIVKNVAPYPSPKSPNNDVPERKSRPVTKSTSMKFLSRIVGSNGDTSSANENGFTTASRNFSVDTLDSPTDSRGRSVNEQKAPNAVQKNGTPVTVTPTPRTGSNQQLSNSSTSVRGQVGPRAGATKPKAPTPPTPAQRTSIDNTHIDDSLKMCKICSRRFHSERIAKHEQICAKTAQKKRKQFDTVTHRVKGTDLESFVQKPMGKKQVQKNVKPEVKTSNWRRKHEDFINAIRSAKQMQEHLAAGGKLSELPPPPRSDTSDYVQCPHCSRKFSKGAAERHVPKCETMTHNKPRVQLRTSVKY